MLGKRETSLYGTETLIDIENKVKSQASILDVEVEFYQSNFEGSLVEFIQENSSKADGIVINPAGLTVNGYALLERLVDHINGWMQNLNPPDHTRNRKLVSLAFTPRMLQRFVPRVEKIVDQLLDNVCAQKETDFYRTFCLPMPAIVICEMLNGFICVGRL